MSNAIHTSKIVSASSLARDWDTTTTAQQPAVLASAKALGRESDHPAWDGMVTAVEALGWPTRFESDFWIHDRAVVARNPPETHFVWCVGETGTTFIWEGDRGNSESLARTIASDRPAFFEWDGATLKRIDFDRLVALLSRRIGR